MQELLWPQVPAAIHSIHSMLVAEVVGDSSDFRPSCDSLPKTLRAFEGSFRRLPELIERDESSSCQAAGSVAAPLLALSAACWECSEAAASRGCASAQLVPLTQPLARAGRQSDQLDQMSCSFRNPADG